MGFSHTAEIVKVTFKFKNKILVLQKNVAKFVLNFSTYFPIYQLCATHIAETPLTISKQKNKILE